MNVAMQEASYKVLSRCYLFSVHTSKFVLNSPSECFQGCKDSKTHLHIWWTCLAAHRFWTKVFDLLCTVLGKSFPLDSAIIILNQSPPDITTSQCKFLLHYITAAKKTVAAVWKTSTLLEVKNRVPQVMIHGKIDASLHVPKYTKMWQPWKHTLCYQTYCDTCRT